MRMSCVRFSDKLTNKIDTALNKNTISRISSHYLDKKNFARMMTWGIFI